MGSSAFDVADLGWLWPGNRGRVAGKDAEMILFANSFNTLPVLFERTGFIVARELPPWSEDLLQNTYLLNVWGETSGSSICLSDASVRKWKKTVKPQMVQSVLILLLHHPALDVDLELLAKGGRPEKLSVVVRAYRELELINEKLPRKEELSRVEAHIRNEVSASTLDRARRQVRKDQTDD